MTTNRLVNYGFSNFYHLSWAEDVPVEEALELDINSDIVKGISPEVQVGEESVDRGHAAGMEDKEEEEEQ
jgi:hypothetical protein